MVRDPIHLIMSLLSPERQSLCLSVYLCVSSFLFIEKELFFLPSPYSKKMVVLNDGFYLLIFE